ncbi:hypothetical protein KUTeg_003445 [Tegillarca granosa]|uniref:Ribosomal protein L27 n=1 Tax=Tegillarca granosa TaxID=220873 RepID=A0ABQ9FM64_TEGGR|nr:hypothetical protein KUTeg_003445 [Tegillarca granosa]
MQRQGFSQTQVCWKSKKNKRTATATKARGIKKDDGSFVHSGEVLVTQLGLSYYPGENVELTRNNSLCAMCDGKVIFSSEKLSPYPDSPLYQPVKNGVVIHKNFVHVLPIPTHGKFRLVSEI